MKLIRILLILFLTACINTINAQTVYTTKTGKKYHKETCKYLKYSKKEITLQKAIELGYSPCSVCKPMSKISDKKKANNISSAQVLTTNEATQKSVAKQCTGKTKSGSRCKRMTKNANGRCYQHQ
ncbi:hypothetical protein [Yeosuana marina]|uniref:hypothetical protein n=1 Tax=Yeosuana marina TaxID=1565536 RepID=UPI0030C819A2